MSLVLMCLNLASASYGPRNISSAFHRELEGGGDGGDYHPRFVVFSLPSESILFIAVRGSVEVPDFNAVLDFNASPFLGGHFVHSGALRSAQWLLGQLDPLISAWRGRIILTGHSLGGTTAAVAAMLLRFDRSNTNVSAICFATFPAISQSLAPDTQSFITTFVVNQDVIPSLNPGNFRAIFGSLLQAGNDEHKGATMLRGVIEKFAESLMANGADSSQTTNISESVKRESIKLTARLLINIKAMGKAGKIVNPGVVYHVIITDNVPDVILFNENVPLGNILELFSGIRDHFIGTYRQVLGQAAKATYPAPKVSGK